MSAFEDPFKKMLDRGSEVASARREIKLAADNAVLYTATQLPELGPGGKALLLSIIDLTLQDSDPDMEQDAIVALIIDRTREYLRSRGATLAASAGSAFERAFTDNLGMGE